MKSVYYPAHRVPRCCAVQQSRTLHYAARNGAKWAMKLIATEKMRRYERRTHEYCTNAARCTSGCEDEHE
jgi:hypothetical protein